ncbi:MAG: DMT family transporter [Acidobacteriota bacterium]
MLGALVLVQVLFGIHYSVVKELLATMSPPAWATLRVAAAAVLLVILARGRGRLLPRGPREWAFAIALAFFGVILNQICFVEGLARTLPAHSALIATTIPLWTLVFAVLRKTEQPTLRRGLALLLGLAGVWVLLEIDRFHLDSELLVGDLLNLLNSASYGLFLVLSQGYASTHGALTATARIFSIGAVGIAFYGLGDLVTTDFGALPASTWWQAAYAVLGATIATYGLNLWLTSRASSSLVALFIYLQPVIATLVDGLVLGRWPSWRFPVAAVLVAAGVALGVSRSKEPAAKGD